MTRLIVLGQLGQNDIAEETEAAETWLGNVWEAVQDLREMVAAGHDRAKAYHHHHGWFRAGCQHTRQVIRNPRAHGETGKTKLMDTDDMYDLMDRMFFSMEFSRLRREQNLSFHQLIKLGTNSYLSVLERGKKPVPTVSILPNCLRR